MNDTNLPFLTRLWFAWACFFRVLFDGSFAARAFAVRSGDAPALPEKVDAKIEMTPKKTPEPPRVDSALQLLALFQREGRLVDFLEQDITAFRDEEVGAASRVVHEGCRKALNAHFAIAPVRAEEEGAKLTLHAGFAPSEIKLSGNVQGEPPFQGVLRHRGWLVKDVTLPTPLDGHDSRILAPAEVEL